MAREPHADRYVGALRSIINGTSTGDEAAYASAAEALEDMADAGELARDEEFYATACSALCYDMAGMRRDAVRMYRLLGGRYSGEFEYIVGSAAHARRLAEGLEALGLGDGGRRLALALDGASSWVRSRAGPDGEFNHDSPDDYNLFFALLNLLCLFFKALRGPDSDGRASGLAERAGRLYDEILQYHPEPLLGFMVSLYLRLVEATYGRSVSRLGMAGGVREALWESGRYALSKSEEGAAAALLGGESLVCRLAAADEKPLLACLCMGAPRSGGGGGGAVAYLAATAQGAERARMGIAGLLGAGGRGADKQSAGGGHFVATYGELGLRLHAGDIAPADLEAIVIDEACDLDGGNGGDASAELDMLLAMLKAEGKARPRIVALTTRASVDAAKRMAAWLGARAVDCGGGAAEEGEKAEPLATGTDVSICYGGMLYRRPQREEPIPLPRDLCRPDGSAPDAAGLCALFVKKSAVTDSPVLISIPRGSDAAGLAGAIASRLRDMEKGDLDLMETALKKGRLWRAFAGRTEIAAGIEYCGPGAAAPLGAGVAFDDERLPWAFRRAVAGGVEDGSICAVVSSSVPLVAAGRSPFKTVLLFSSDPAGSAAESAPHTAGRGALEYWQAVEMAGRAGRDRRGEVFVVAASESECGMLRRRLWGGAAAEAAPQQDGIPGMLRPVVATHLVRMAGEAGGATLDDMMARMSLTWLWESSGAAGRKALGAAVGEILAELDELRLVAPRRGAGGGRVYEPTELGARACRSPLPVLWAARAVRALRASWGEGGAARTARFYADFGAEAAPAAPAGGPRTPPYAHLHDAAGAWPCAPASQMIGAKAAAVGWARALLHLADLVGADADPAGNDMSEELGRAAVHHMSSSFKAAADLSKYYAAHSECKRARLLVDHLAKDVPALQKIAPQGGLLLPANSCHPRRDAEAFVINPTSLAKHCSFAISPVYTSRMEVSPVLPRHREHSPSVFGEAAVDLLRLFEANAQVPQQRGALVEMHSV